jgi:hypothetical protein
VKSKRIVIGWLFFLGMSNHSFAFPGARDSSDTNTCLECHGNTSPQLKISSPLIAPELPKQFSMDWKMFEFSSDQRPPFSSIPKPNSFLPGETHYDWDSQSMTEIYPDKCIDIFPNGRDFSCQFTSVADKTYLIKYSGRDNSPDSCCLWSESGFWAPRPDVLKNMVFDQKMIFDGSESVWWTLDIPLPGPFGYGTFRNSKTPVAFWFPVINGWVQQDFFHFSTEKPDSKYFELPQMCLQNPPVCG